MLWWHIGFSEFFGDECQRRAAKIANVRAFFAPGRVNAELTQHGDEAQPLTLNFLRDLALRLSIHVRLSLIRSYRGFFIVLLPLSVR
jgi:hypothetical protein